MMQTLKVRWGDYRRRRRAASSTSSGSAGASKTEQVVIIALLVLLLFLTMVPVLFMLVTSLKNRGQIYTQFWALPNPPLWENYQLGWNGMRSYIINSLLFGTISVAAWCCCPRSAATCLRAIASRARRSSTWPSWRC